MKRISSPHSWTLLHVQFFQIFFQKIIFPIDMILPTHDGDVEVVVEQEPLTLGFGLSTDAGKLSLNLSAIISHRIELQG